MFSEMSLSAVHLSQPSIGNKTNSNKWICVDAFLRFSDEYGETCSLQTGSLRTCNPNKAYECTNNRCTCSAGHTYYAPQSECVFSQCEFRTLRDSGVGERNANSHTELAGLPAPFPHPVTAAHRFVWNSFSSEMVISWKRQKYIPNHTNIWQPNWVTIMVSFCKITTIKTKSVKNWSFCTSQRTVPCEQNQHSPRPKKVSKTMFVFHILLNLTALRDLQEGAICDHTSNTYTSKWCADGLVCTTCPVATASSTQCMTETKCKLSQDQTRLLSAVKQATWHPSKILILKNSSVKKTRCPDYLSLGRRRDMGNSFTGRKKIGSMSQL